MQNLSNDKKWRWILHRLHTQGLNFNKLSTLYNCNRSNFSHLKNRPCPKYEKILANILEIDPWDIWPDRYDSVHNPARVSSRYQGHKNFSMGNINNGKRSSDIDAHTVS